MWLKRSYETRLTLSVQKEKRKTADGKRKPETEEISITCAGIEPNQNSVCQVTPGEDAALSPVKACDEEHAVGLLRHRAEK